MEEVAGGRRLIKSSSWPVRAVRRLIKRKITAPCPRTKPLIIAGPGHIFL